MRIAVLADEEKWKELINLTATGDWKKFSIEEDWLNASGYDAYINLKENAAGMNYPINWKFVLINSVVKTLKEINPHPNLLRMNGWNGFIDKPIWEIAGAIGNEGKQFFSFTGKQFSIVPDEPGFIAPRIVSMIINEAWFALEEKVSSKDEIDKAMKLGTNYPYGPFEWCMKIGAENVYMLLKELSLDDNRYLPAPLLAIEAGL